MQEADTAVARVRGWAASVSPSTEEGQTNLSCEGTM